MDAHKDRILVVDDVVENIQIVGEILKSRYEVKLALNGSKALEIAGSDAPPDLILLDVMMPGMDGYAVCESLKANPLTHEIPVIFLSSLHETDDKVKALALGAVDFVTKPFEPQEVLARVRAHPTEIGTCRRA
ncbi:MAG: response regulator [Candidatus Wallbacteria bacterium]|nr:response regulator [Candidatus Wallbacteria bacterium]